MTKCVNCSNKLSVAPYCCRNPQDNEILKGQVAINSDKTPNKYLFLNSTLLNGK